jgi:hypothetical protein
MANIPANPSAALLIQGQSITGSFAGFTVCTNAGAGTYAVFTGLKDANGVNLAVSGSPATIRFLEGQTYPIFVTSASLATPSANVLFYT